MINPRKRLLLLALFYFLFQALVYVIFAYPFENSVDEIILTIIIGYSVWGFLLFAILFACSYRDF